MPDTTQTALPQRRGGTIDWGARRQGARQWRRYWIRDPLLGALDYAIHRACRLLPTEWCSAIGARLGVLNGRRRYHAVRERAVSFYRSLAGEDVTLPEAKAAVMRLFDNTGRVMLEFSALDRLWEEGRIVVAGAEHLRAARVAGQPVIVMGLHLGNWEVIGPSLIGLGLHGLRIIYQPPRSRFEHRIAVVARERYGATMLRPGVAAARIARRLLVNERGVLLIYADEERQGRISAPLFGRRAPHRANIRTIVRLAWASGAAVIPAYAGRQQGARFCVTFLPPVELAASGADPDTALQQNIDRLDNVITPLVLAHLGEWYMLLEAREI